MFALPGETRPMANVQRSPGQLTRTTGPKDTRKIERQASSVRAHRGRRAGLTPHSPGSLAINLLLLHSLFYRLNKSGTPALALLQTAEPSMPNRSLGSLLYLF